jgi:IS6 family transposase
MKLIFKWRHYQADIILFALRWYASTALTYRQLANLLNERGLSINHTTIALGTALGS